MLNLKSLVLDLPEDVLKRKWSGDFEGEIALIDALLAKDLPELLRDRLLVERCIAELLPQQYPYSRAEALDMLRAKIPDFAESELDALELDRAVDSLYVGGEKRYLRSFLSTLLKVHPDLAKRAGQAFERDALLDDAIRALRREGHLAYRIRIRGTLRIADANFHSGAHARVHLPLPQRCAQQRDIEIAPGAFSADDALAPQRTAFFERLMAENEPFVVEYAYRSAVHYVDPLAGAPAEPLYPDAPAPCADDLAEQLPHIAFSPIIRALAHSLADGERDPIRVAWRFYDYITTQIRYSFMRPYFLIDRHADYCALNGKGDCGIQALLFIALCRCAGIPARWQSGLAVDERSAGCHDWAQFYVEPFGWLFCDPSYGGSAHRAGDEAMRKFYFGNLDPFRMVANSRYQTDFNPPARCDRADPYDNQEGEVELDGTGLTSAQFDTRYETLELVRLN